MGHDVSGDTILAVGCVLIGLSTVAVAGRFYARFWLRRDGGNDDWLILAALIWALAMAVSEGMQVRYGLGSKGQVLSSIDPNFLLAFWATIWPYHLSMGFCRLSVVLQCLRIFPQANHGWVKWFMRALAVANGLNMVWATMSSILTCVPVSKYWHPEQEGHCMSWMILYTTNSTLAMALDFAVAILPVPWIRSLLLPIRQKVLLSAIFILAGFPCVIAAIRVQSLIEVTSKSGSDFSYGILAMLSCAEVYAAIICACLPSLKACWNHLRPRCIRHSHAICHWFPCSSCEYFSAGSFNILPQRLDSWLEGRRRGRHANTVFDTRMPQPQGVADTQQLEVQMSQQAHVQGPGKVVKSTTEQNSNQAAATELGTLIQHFGVLPSITGLSDDTMHETTRMRILPSVTGYTGTTWVESTATTEPG
ncbi:hypothetical protein DOTSEDRAFT_125706 [Dothistroma septosporum NZE10]|uniref:Rhodopsin domain-containing protein n=1 Tax=Dothistroma septosporum (strain NZE10 / CBS 128990) TaxID=675120 RepID=N1PV39_DOTSN|nr:hypothetical protein DOTSEDRAFT_125706 [Dothistroma septosporum NZE10]